VVHDCAAADAEIARLRAEVAALQARLAKLEQAAAPVPHWVKERNRKARKSAPGARVGHEPKHREEKLVDEEKKAELSSCPTCETALGDAIEIRERIVEELVPARLKVTKYHVHRYWCTNCKEKVDAQPAGVLPGQRFGLHLMLLVCYLRTLGVTWEKTRVYLATAFGIRISHGALIHMEEAVAEALGPKYNELLEEVRKAKSAHTDDTSWRIDGENHWLWIMLTKTAAVFTIENTRGRRVVEDALGPSFKGVVVGDFAPTYKNMPYEQQKCLVHLQRLLKKPEEKPDFIDDPEWSRITMRVRSLVTQAVNAHENERNPVKKAQLAGSLMAQAAMLGDEKWTHKEAKTLARLLKGYHMQLFTFLLHDDVGWENNPAERGLRPMVVNRKTSFGSRSTEGAQRLAIIQSVAQTARLRDTSFLSFAGAALSGNPAGQMRP